jgi:hypothetical protein
MPRLYFVPGFGGSELNLVQRNSSGVITGRQQLWGGVGQVVNQRLWHALALPQPPDIQGTIEVGDVAWQLESYGDFLGWLPTAFNASQGVRITQFPYDFRQHAVDLGRLLAARILASSKTDGPVWILAHSYGALVAWCAWAALVDAGQINAVSRITTFGGILYGSACSATAWAELESGIDLLALVGQASQVFPTFGNAFGRSMSAFQFKKLLLQIFLSWPANYCMLPAYGHPEDAQDTNREDLYYSADPWALALVQPQQSLMFDAYNRLWTYILNPKYLPPRNVINHIIGTGQNTPWRIQPPRPVAANFARPGAYGEATLFARLARQANLPYWTVDPDGDGRATQAQQALAGYSREFCTGVHGDLQNNDGVRWLIPLLLTRSEAIPQPVPPPPPAPPQQAYLFDGSLVQTTPIPRPVGGSIGAPPRIVRKDP